MDKKQLYLIGGISGFFLVVLVTMMSYYIFRFKKDFEAEQASRISFQEKSVDLERELTTTRAELEAKKNKIGIFENTIDEIQARASNLSEAKAKVKAEKMKLLAEKRRWEEELRRKEEEFRDLRESLQKEIQDKESPSLK